MSEKMQWRRKSVLDYISVTGVEPARECVAGKGDIYHKQTVTANAPFACWQYPCTRSLTGGPQLFVIYHGAPGCGCFGSLMSLAACAWILTA